MLLTISIIFLARWTALNLEMQQGLRSHVGNYCFTN